MEKANSRQVVVSALQFACSDDVSTNLATAERYLSHLLCYFFDVFDCYLPIYSNFTRLFITLLGYAGFFFSLLLFHYSHHHLS